MIIRLGLLLTADDRWREIRTAGAFQDVLWQLTVPLVHFAGCFSLGIVCSEVVAGSA